MTIYKHVVTLIVLTPECSPDAVIRRAEAGFTTSGERADGTVTAAGRARTPYMRVADPPAYPTDTTKASLAAYDNARDAWIDRLPTIDTFTEDGRA